MKQLNRGLYYKVLPTVNVLLLVSALFFCGSLLLKLLHSSKNSFIFDNSCLAASGPLDWPPGLVLESSVGYKRERFSNRDLFIARTRGIRQSAQGEFQLLGLISAGEKTAAMIRDLSEKKDYYCLGGEKIGSYIVKEILKDRVILESEGKTLEITK